MSCLMFDDEAVAGLVPDTVLSMLPFTATSDASYGLISVDMGGASKKLVSIVIDGPSGYWVGQYAQDGQYAYARVTDWQGNVRTNKTVTGYVYYIG